MKKVVYQCSLRLAERFKSGGPSLGRSPWRAQAASPRQSRSNPIFGDTKGSTQFSEQGFSPCSFFNLNRASRAAVFSRQVFFLPLENIPYPFGSRRGGPDGANQSDPAQF